MLYVPTAVLLPTAIVMVDEPEPGAAIGLGLKLTVVPVGAPLADRLMALLKPPLTVVVMVEVPWAPCATLTEVGAALMVKLGGAMTVSVTLVVCWVPPPLPVTVMLYVPTAVLLPTAIVMVDEPEPGAAIGLGLKLTVVPVGAPLADRLMALLKPPLTVVVMVEVPWAPCATLTEVGAALMVKLGGAMTVSVTLVVCWVPPPLPVTVMLYVPTAVLLPTAIVMVDEPEPGAAIGLGLKLTVVPVGAPLADRLMALLKPPLTVVVMVEVPWAPCATLTEVGAALMVKLGGAMTVSVTLVVCWVPPPLPVTVMLYVPTAVLLPTAIVMVDEPEPGAAIGLGLKLTVVPVGAPLADRLMALLKPPLTVVVMVEVPWAPCATLTEVGAALMVKLGGAMTVSVTLVVCWVPPPLPVTVMLYVPAAVLLPTAIVMVDEPEPGAAIGLGLKLTVVPVGTPLADRLMALLKPPLTVVVMVEVPWAPCATLTEVGAALMVKSAGAVTVSVTLVVCWVPPLLPVTVML